jgi:hypothetical protein
MPDRRASIFHSSGSRLGSLLALAFALALQGCHGCRTFDFPVSSPPSDSGGAHRSFPQSETTMVRIDQLGERPRGEPGARFLTAYNDATAAMLDAGAACWSFNPERPTLDGWSRSDLLAGDWQRQDQLPVSSGLRDQGVGARHGDPWLAAWNPSSGSEPGVVLYVSVGQSGLSRYGAPWFLLLSRSRDRGLSFEEPMVLLGPQPVVPDGPKVAIAGDGLLAVVVWNEGSAGIPYRLVWNLTDPAMATGGTGLIHPETIADPPQPGCTFAGAAAHPRVAAGRSRFYIAARVSYSCPSGQRQRLEVYRNLSIGLALGAPWQRILSVEVPPSLPSSSLGILNAQNASGTPRFGANVDRGSSLPTLAVGQAPDGEFVVLAELQTQAGKLPDESQSEKIILFRRGRADGCDAAHHKGDLDSCGERLSCREIDAIATPGSLRTIESRAGVWESKPALFIGKVPDGTVDQRVGLVWYTQPYKGRVSVTDEMRARTIVEAAVSEDAGLTFSGPFNLSAPGKDDRPPEDPAIGSYFYPCQILCSGYFGEYVSGVFEFADPDPTAIVATWGDSREGCADQSVHTHHHHVWAGALRPY